MRNLGLCIFVTFWILCAGEDKRAPSGFTGVRGKKSDSDEVSNEYTDKKIPYGFPEAAVQRSYDNWTPSDNFGLYKRLPSGFFGLRGKKNVDFLWDDKRVPSGFFGMRGKKFIEDYEDPFEKRPSSSSFWGMRGKREYDNLYDIKRAPESRFFGMRGKRQPNKNSFFGMRGKKYDIRGKFVGVRGKKSMEMDNSEYLDDDLSRYDDISLDQLMYFLSQNERN